MRRLKLTLFALASLLLCSCSAYKKVPYLQGSEYLNMANVQTPLYDAHIMPKDLLITGTLISRSWAHCTSAASPKARRKT